jgi:hypothetical protein
MNGFGIDNSVAIPVRRHSFTHQYYALAYQMDKLTKYSKIA